MPLPARPHWLQGSATVEFRDALPSSSRPRFWLASWRGGGRGVNMDHRGDRGTQRKSESDRNDSTCTQREQGERLPRTTRLPPVLVFLYALCASVLNSVVFVLSAAAAVRPPPGGRSGWAARSAATPPCLRSRSLTATAGSWRDRGSGSPGRGAGTQAGSDLARRRRQAGDAPGMQSSCSPTRRWTCWPGRSCPMSGLR